jgi:hypothetical protein
LVEQKKTKNDKVQDKRKKNQEPGDSRVSITAHQVQYPGPEKDENEFDKENNGGAWDASTERAHTIHILISHVLE